MLADLAHEVWDGKGGSLPPALARELRPSQALPKCAVVWIEASAPPARGLARSKTSRRSLRHHTLMC